MMHLCKTCGSVVGSLVTNLNGGSEHLNSKFRVTLKQVLIGESWGVEEGWGKAQRPPNLVGLS